MKVECRDGVARMVDQKASSRWVVQGYSDPDAMDGTGEKQLSHFAVLITLALSRMHMNISQRCMMIRKDSLHDAILLLTKVDVEVFGSYIEVILVTLSEVKAMGIDWLPIILSTTDLRLLWRDRCYTPLGLLLSAEERVSLGIYEHSRSPVAHFTIVTDSGSISPR